MPDSRPIGVFDSGIGGLTVFRALASRLPGEQILYLGDTARVPYGTKSDETVTRYTRECARFLLNRRIKLLVVACNTAPAVALPSLAGRISVPTLGVLQPGAERACSLSCSGRIAVIGTDATIRSGAYAKAIRAIRADAVVTSIACPLFVPLAEEGWIDGEVARLVAEKYLAPLKGIDSDALVLGCTHYPLLKGVVSQVLGPAIRLVDSAEAVASEAARVLTESQLLAPREGHGEGHHFYVTDSSQRFAEVGSRFLGTPLERLEQVDITGEA